MEPNIIILLETLMFLSSSCLILGVEALVLLTECEVTFPPKNTPENSFLEDVLSKRQESIERLRK